MSLQDKTDFELNVLVAMREHPELAEFPEKWIREGENGEAIFLTGNVNGNRGSVSVYIYTGDWAQMGPIIEREGISLDMNRMECLTGDDEFINGKVMAHTENLEFSQYDESPLRAAAICYLMMKGAES